MNNVKELKAGSRAGGLVMQRSSADRRTLLPRFTMSILRALQCSPTTVMNRIRSGVERPLRESLVKPRPVELPCTDESRALSTA